MDQKVAFVTRRLECKLKNDENSTEKVQAVGNGRSYNLVVKKLQHKNSMSGQKHQKIGGAFGNW